MFVAFDIKVCFLSFFLFFDGFYTAIWRFSWCFLIGIQPCNWYCFALVVYYVQEFSIWIFTNRTEKLVHLHYIFCSVKLIKIHLCFRLHCSLVFFKICRWFSLHSIHHMVIVWSTRGALWRPLLFQYNSSFWGMHYFTSRDHHG